MSLSSLFLQLPAAMEHSAAGKKGCDLLIVLQTLAAEGCPQLALQLARYWQRQGLRLELLLLEPEPSDLLGEFQAIGLAIHSLRLGQGLARYPRLALLVYRLCRRQRPAAVLSFPLGWHALIALGARLAGVRRVCAHVGNLPPVWTGRSFRRFRLLVQLGRPFTHRLLCCSEYIRSATVRDFGLRVRETRTIYNACDLERCAVLLGPDRRAGAWPRRAPPRLAMVARLEGHKDQPTLIRAVAILRDQGFPLELWLVGEGSRRPQLEALIAEFDLHDRVQLLGSRRDIPDLLEEVDLFVFSARPDEGFGIALAEAMAAGLPIVASDVGACREVLDEGRCGLLVPPGSAAALAGGIRAALADSKGVSARVEAARRRAFEQFSVASMAVAYGRELGIVKAPVQPAL